MSGVTCGRQKIPGLGVRWIGCWICPIRNRLRFPRVKASKDARDLPCASRLSFLHLDIRCKPSKSVPATSRRNDQDRSSFVTLIRYSSSGVKATILVHSSVFQGSSELQASIPSSGSVKSSQSYQGNTHLLTILLRRIGAHTTGT